MSSEPTLLSMPEVVKDHLFQYLSYIDIARLHKTCPSLRDYINVSRPDASYRMIEVFQAVDNIQVMFETEDKDGGPDFFSIIYREHEGGCLIETAEEDREDTRTRSVSGVNYLETFFRDFGMVLKHQKSILRDMALTPHNTTEQRSQFWKAMQKVFEESGRIKSQRCFLQHVTAPDVLSILSFFDSTCIEKIHLTGMEDGRVNPMDGIIQMEHWKNLKSAILDDFSIGNIAQNIAHLNYFACDTSELTGEDVLQIKNMFLNTPTISSCHFNFRDSSIKQNLYDSLGPAEERQDNEPEEKKRWSFRSPIAKQELEVKIMHESIWFERILK